jgi:type II secretory pathway pseudopilin PulG
MKRRSLSVLGFSLVEVIITIGVISFAFVGLLGVFPLALDQSRACINETRSAQLARMVFATLASETYTSAQCFAEAGGSPLDLSTLNSTTDPVVLFASYDVRNEAKIVRTASAPSAAEYRLELRFEPATTSSGSTRGTLVRLKIVDEPARRNIVFEGTQFLGKSPRAVFAK